MYKVRTFPEKNYRAVYFNGKTIRIAIDPTQPIQDLDYPEFYDIKITDKCDLRCPYCYQNSSPDNDLYDDAYGKLANFFEGMDENQKPFQIAYGGGEPTIHPNFIGIMKLTRAFGIAPNYTTNGQFIHDVYRADAIINATKEYCEGVAVTCHENTDWETCTAELVSEGIFTNLHVLISDYKSVDRFIFNYSLWSNHIKYFVLLPMVEKGRAKNVNVDYEYLFQKIEGLFKRGYDLSNIAFGANFYPFLGDKSYLNLSLYEPEIMSKYLDLKDMSLYKSSFDTDEPIRRIIL
jgi:hypothetical protein